MYMTRAVGHRFEKNIITTSAEGLGGKAAIIKSDVVDVVWKRMK